MLNLIWTMIACAPLDTATPADTASGHFPKPFSERDTSEDTAPRFERDALDVGQAWRWLGDEDVEIIIVPEPSGEWEDGIYICRGEDMLATWSQRPWADTPGWVPMLLVGLDGEPYTIEDTLVIKAIGSAEHGADPETWVLITPTHRDDGSVGVAVEIDGMPYLAMPPDSSVEQLNGDPVRIPGEEGAVLEDVRSVRLATPWGALGFALEQPVPWMQLQPHEDFLELDFDHSAEQGVTSLDMRLDLVLSK